MPAGPREPAVPGTAPERALGLGLHLRRDLAGLRLCGLRHRRLRPAHRRLAVSAARHMRASCSMHWSRLCMSGSPSARRARPSQRSRQSNTSRSATPSAWPKPASSPRSAASATATTTPLAETINGLYKAEVIHRRGPGARWKPSSSRRWNGWIWFNNRRLLEPIGNIPPAEAEERYYASWRPSHGSVNSNQPASGKPGAVQCGL